MQIKLSDRAKECADKFRELTQEMEDYNQMVMCIRAMQAVELNPEKFTYDPKDYDEVLAYLRSLCAKHEVVLPNTDYIEWRTIEIV